MILPSRELMPIICTALERGQRVRLTVTGTSMLPFIHNNDIVELKPASAPRLGDVMLVQIDQPDATERYVLHHIVRIERGSAYIVRGDSQRHSEGPFAHQSLLGSVATSRHNGATRNHDSGVWRVLGLIWVYIGPIGFFLVQRGAWLRRIGGKALQRVHQASRI
jgi:hypothetical protein